MNVTHLSETGGEVILAIEIDDERVEKHLDEASKRVAQRVNVPGFRKGKAPKAVLTNFVGREYLLEESMRTLVPEAVDEAINGEGLDPWAVPQVDIEEMEPVIKLKATVPLRPTVELGDYRSISFDDVAEEVTDEQVDAVLEDIRRAHGYTRTAERPAEVGDIVVFSGKATAGESLIFDVSDQEFLVTPENPTGIDGFTDELVGMKSGDERIFQGKLQGRSEARIDQGDEGADGEDGEAASTEEEQIVADVRVQVNEVKEVVLPDVDDELAKTYGQEGIETLDDLRTDIRKRLETQSEHALRTVLETKAIGALVEGSEFHISPIIISREGRNLVDRELQRFEAYYGKNAARSRIEDLEQDSFDAAEQSAEMNIKRALVLEKVTELEQIEISDDDVLGEIESINTSIQGTDLNPLEDTPDTRESIRDNLRTRRAIDLLVNIARGVAEDQSPTEQSPE